MSEEKKLCLVGTQVKDLSPLNTSRLDQLKKSMARF
jgi:hypothetical protein